MSETSNPKRRGLGRGLGALIINTESPENPASAEVVAQAGEHVDDVEARQAQDECDEQQEGDFDAGVDELQVSPEPDAGVAAHDAAIEPAAHEDKDE